MASTGERVGPAGGADRRAFERIEGDIDLRTAGADLFADIKHRRFVALAFADHNRAVDAPSASKALRMASTAA